MGKWMVNRFLLLVMISCLASPVDAIDPGERLFGLHCAVCHGEKARGDGPMAMALNIKTSDLTRLKEHNQGVFPLSQTIAQIDGRRPLTAHGGPMPVYGWFFDGPPAVVSDPVEAPVETTEAIAKLVMWLQSIQSED